MDDDEAFGKQPRQRGSIRSTITSIHVVNASFIRNINSWHQNHLARGEKPGALNGVRGAIHARVGDGYGSHQPDRAPIYANQFRPVLSVLVGTAQVAADDGSVALFLIFF